MTKWDVLFFACVFAVFTMLWPWIGGADMWRPQSPKLWVAKWLYYKSLGFDNSEVFSGAREKHKARLVQLHRRIGDEEFRRWLDKDTPAHKRTPEWFGKYSGYEWR